MWEITRIVVVIVPLTLVLSRFYPKGWLQFIAMVAAFCFSYGLGLYWLSKQLRTEAMLLFQYVLAKFFKTTPEDASVL